MSGTVAAVGACRSARACPSRRSKTSRLVPRRLAPRGRRQQLSLYTIISKGCGLGGNNNTKASLSPSRLAKCTLANVDLLDQGERYEGHTADVLFTKWLTNTQVRRTLAPHAAMARRPTQACP